MSDENKKGLNDGKKVTPKVVDTRTVAEKDGSQPQHRPDNVIKSGAAGFSPMGTVPVKRSRNVNITVTSEELPDREVSVPMDRSDINIEYESHGFTTLVRRDDEKSALGIDGGHISRLTLAKGKLGDEQIFAHYDDGKWLKKPDTFLAKQAVMEAKNQDNGITRSSMKPDFSKSHDPDIDI
jgi:hypothetical protein